MTLNTPVSQLFMVGPVYARRLKRLGIETVEDLIYHFPFRYEDYSLVSEIAKVQPGETVTIRGEVVSMKNEYTRLGKKIQKAIVADAAAKIEITWFNQPFLVKTIKVGERYQFSGKADWFGKKIILISPEYEPIRNSQFAPRSGIPLRGTIRNLIHTGRLVPVYPETYSISSKWLRAKINLALSLVKNELKEYLPLDILFREKLIPYKEAVLKIHFPENKIAAEKARERLAFDELFLIQLAGTLRKKEWEKKPAAHKFFIDREKNLKFIAALPFQLTEAQKRCLGEILTDLTFNKPMNRLLEGDVGSGKTVVAAAAMYTAYLNGFQSVLMAPTEILAFQHYQTVKTFLEPYGPKIALLTGSKKFDIAHLAFDIFIGTQALIQKNISFENLGLAVIDEQHRFGVQQRGELMKKACPPTGGGTSSHLLTMTATPIPRTITLTLYGDLDLSVLDEMPPGRQRVKTWVVPPLKREAAYNWIREHVKGTDEQAFIICPLIEESETLKAVKAATVEFEKLVKKVFPDLKLGLLHGRLKSKEKEAVITQFRHSELDVLVSTPVVEVGIDIPQATIMMIEGADRFGLAQLHQLRGRVGRGNKPSYCLLFSESESSRAIKRLKAMERLYVGIELAELDLQMRGPGEIYGLKQHGFPDLRVASFGDTVLIQKARAAAQATVLKLPRFPLLQEKLKKYTIKQIQPN